MPVFTKESHNHFDVDHFEVDNSFGFRITVDGDYFAFAGSACRLRRMIKLWSRTSQIFSLKVFK